ncbi:hypothetical protein PBI_PEREGRIN_257 [Rhodococcus phage Peregrin]|jgi:hypothetical protein|nr:hypothetical protein PBI_PEREGRIN_257 [Rhodococcus phage Peregrin]
MKLTVKDYINNQTQTFDLTGDKAVRTITWNSDVNGMPLVEIEIED